MPYTLAEEDYLKAIYKVAERTGSPVNTSAIAVQINTSAASVTDMLRKLAEKGLVNYQRYKGVSLSKEGVRIATQLIRKHRLWEVFLVEKLGFTWDAVHDIAEQLEHIQSDNLVDKLDAYLAFPRFDPHGDPIPDASGAYRMRQQILLSDMAVGQEATIVGVKEHAAAFLQYLDKEGLHLGTALYLIERLPFDGSVRVRMSPSREVTLSEKSASFIYVTIVQ